MSQRLLNTTKCLFCLLALYAGPVWSPVGSVTVRNPPKTPSTIEAQAKFFQDFFSVQLSPYKIEFGHVCEDPNTWEQRYEKKDFKNHRDMGKVRWGDKHGGYGEHYWDLNHAGHAGNHGNSGYEGDSDDGSYDPDRYSDRNTYEEPNEQAAKYDEDYDPEKDLHYEEGGRTKRAHPRIKPERKRHVESNYEEEPQTKQKRKNKNKEQLQAAPSHNEEEVLEEETEDDEEVYKTTVTQKRPQQKKSSQEPEQNEESYQKQTRDQTEFQPPQKEVDAQEQPSQYVPRKQPELTHYVPYERGAGIRQYHPPDYAVAASAPRLFLDPSTGHVIDRATGQAYVLQPIVVGNKY